MKLLVKVFMFMFYLCIGTGMCARIELALSDDPKQRAAARRLQDESGWEAALCGVCALLIERSIKREEAT